ncbi:MAG TPA: alpha,alpha-trehalase TreF [Bacteroidales bacterium]|nr:alpha,alpha-trehalase TreF [Bacteroidales bacterium]
MMYAIIQWHTLKKPLEMKNLARINIIFVLIFSVLLITDGCQPKSHRHYPDDVMILPPSELYGQLFYDVQNSEISEFRDSKTFCDCVPLFPLEMIMQSYHKIPEPVDTTTLKNFVEQNFLIPRYTPTFTDSSNILTHINMLWDTLTRQPDLIHSGTLIPLPNPYIIPGGRFREVYYWDSYFIMIGLKEAGKTELMHHIIDNFSYLIRMMGFIPNGNRTYYLSRSQPPFYPLMVELLADALHDSTILLHYMPNIKEEYAFWMDGSKDLNDSVRAIRNVVRMDKGTVLNRYWDNLATPRPESYREDRHTAAGAKDKFGRAEQETYRNLRAAAESGWDFSSRWFKDTASLLTIHTTDIVPVDLNALLYHMEMTLARAYAMKEMKDSSLYFNQKAKARQSALINYCWNNQNGFFMDYDFRAGQQTSVYSLAGVYPLFFRLADTLQAKKVAATIRNKFLKDGGVVTTTNFTGEQWDAPNGWAPLQWLTIQGLRNYGSDPLADSIKTRWLQLNRSVYYNTWKMVEKYNVVDTAKAGGGGEYPNQDGFGWTNGVYSVLAKTN